MESLCVYFHTQQLTKCARETKDFKDLFFVHLFDHLAPSNYLTNDVMDSVIFSNNSNRNQHYL